MTPPRLACAAGRIVAAPPRSRPREVASRWTARALAASLGLAALAPARAAAESAASEVDAELEITADPIALDPDQTSTLRVLLRNEGSFAIDDSVVAVRLPPALTLVSAEPGQGSFDGKLGEWTTGEVLPFGSAQLELTVRASAGDAAATVVTEVMSLEISYDGTDRDSVAGNGDPCEDDQAQVTLSISGGDDAGTEEADAGPACPGPADAGASAPDAAVGAPDPDAGPIAEPDEGCGCSGSGRGGAGSILLVLAALVAVVVPRRR
jgi:hypothetical protein